MDILIGLGFLDQAVENRFVTGSLFIAADRYYEKLKVAHLVMLELPNGLRQQNVIGSLKHNGKSHLAGGHQVLGDFDQLGIQRLFRTEPNAKSAIQMFRELFVS